MGEADWERAKAELEAIVAREGTILDPLVAEAVIGLRCLGFPTFGSCQGHLEPEELSDGLVAEHYPHIGFRRPFLPSRFLCGDGIGGLSALWLRTIRGTQHERHYMAVLAWRVYRPMRFRLLDLQEEFRATTGRDRLLFTFRTSWEGVDMEPHEQPDGPWIEQTEENLTRYQEELIAFGAFLRDKVTRG